MSTRVLFVAIIALFFFFTTIATAAKDWEDLEFFDDMDRAIARNPENKPILLLICRNEFELCQEFYDTFQYSEEFTELEDRYQLVLFENVPKQLSMSYIDGLYMPRVGIFSPDGEFQEDLLPDSPREEYPFLANDAEDLIDIMREGLSRFPN